MAVYDRAYRGYSGPRTSEGARFAVIPRYALADVFRSRLLTALFVVSFVAPLITSIRIYLAHNLDAIATLDIGQGALAQLLAIDPAVFLHWVVVPQSILAFLLALAVGPALISPDLRNNGMALYLARPLSRRDYVGGKLVVLLALLSAITWVPALLLLAFQGYLAGFGWVRDNLRLWPALVTGFGAWMLLLSLVALAISAAVKWKPLARLLFLALPFVLEAFGGVLNVTFRTYWGDVLRTTQLLDVMWTHLLGLEPGTAPELSPGAVWLAFAAVAGLCLAVLARRIRAYEVER
jgi:ABC-2 type transport system permease protein